MDRAILRAPDALRKGFANPPASARLRCYWWWLNGHTNEATITRDLEEMQKKGYGGVLLVDANGANQNGNDNVPAGPEFGSPEWTALYVHALKEADRLGLEVTLNITSGWNLGGPWVQPEQASKLLTWSRTTVRAGDCWTDYALASSHEERLLSPDRCPGLSPASRIEPAGKEWRHAEAAV